MSTHWDLYCLDCNDYAGFHIKSGEVVLAGLWAGRVGIAGLDLTIDTGHRSLRLQLDNENVDPTFFTKHLTHNVRRRSEYGQYDGDCREYVNCPTCKHPHHCGLANGHAGDHVPRTT